MIPLELSLEGLFAYRSRQTLDFRPLIDAGLFGILGPTGSGKSALLEAILLALYDRCPRKEGNSLAPILNRNSSSLSIELRFQLETAHGAQLYRCLYQASFTPKGKLRSKKHLLQHWDGREWRLCSTSPESVISELLGLDYANFCRAILLPQGQFQNFLLLTPAERAEVLQQLFQLSHYDVYDTISTLARETSIHLTERHRAYTELQERTSDELFLQLQQESEHLRHQVEQCESNIRKLEEEEKQLSLLQSHWQKYEELRKRLQTLQQQESSLLQRHRLLEICLRLQPLWERLRRLQEEYNRAAEQLKQKQQEEKKLRSELDTLRAQYEPMRRIYERRHLLQQEQQLHQDALHYTELCAKQQELLLRLQKGEQLLREREHKYQELLQRLEELHYRQKQWSEELSLLPEIIHWYDRAQSLQGELIRARSEHERLNQKERALLRDLYHRCQALPIELRPTAAESTEAVQELEQIVIRLENTLLQSQQQLESLLRLQHAAELARSLVPGAPCPVCGSTSHPNPCPPDPTLQTRSQELRTEVENLRNTINCLREWLTELRSRLEELTEQRQRIQHSLASLEQSLREHRHRFRWSCWDPENPSEGQRAQSYCDELRRKLQNSAKEEEQLRQQLATVQKEKDSLSQHYVRLAAERDSLQEECEFLRQKLPDKLLTAPSDTLRRRLQEIQEQHQRLEQEYPRIEQAYQERHHRHTHLLGECEQLKRRLHELEIELQHQRALFQQRCTEEALSPEEVANSLEYTPDIASELHRLQRIEAHQKALEEQLRQLEPEAIRYDPIAHEHLRTQLQHARQSLQTLQHRLGQLQEKLSSLERDRQQQKELQRQIERLSIRNHQLTELEKLFRGGAFIRFIAQTYLHSLCERANLYFRQWTHGSLALEVSEEAHLTIRDFSHNASLRPVRTLSGGQLFQASLALALALSDMVRATSGLRRCLFFIDEGFGNLDRDNLALVLDTLRQLRRQGRLVGIISHREELQQELDSYVRISRHEQYGSIIHARDHRDSGYLSNRPDSY